MPLTPLRRLRGVALAIGLSGVLTTPPAHADVAACIASSEQALTLRRSGRLLEARRELASCAAIGCPDEVRSDCAKRIEAVNGFMPSIVVGAKDVSGNDLTQAELALDGVQVASILDGRPLEVDPGEHVLRVTARGLPTAERRIVIGEGERARHEELVLGVPVPAPPPSAAPSATNHELDTRRKLAIVAAASGVVGVGLGVTFGLIAGSDWSSAKSAVTAQASCASAAACPAHTNAVSDHSSADTFATASTVGFVAGSALLAAGVVTWLTAPSRERVSARTSRPQIVPAVSQATLGLTVAGAF